MKNLIKWIHLPLFLIGGNGLAVFIVSRGLPAYWLMLLVCVLIGISYLFERLLPYTSAFNRSQGDSVRDWLHAIVNEGLNIVGWLLLPILSGYLALGSYWPEHWPLVLQLALAVLVADLGITLVHYASHHSSLLWRLHAVHHSVTRMYGFNGLMKHPLHQLIETAAGIFPLILLGVTQDVMMLLIVAGVIQLLLQHSNVNYAVGPLRYFLAINQVHRFHHLGLSKEGNVNFGFFTTLIDRLLGTAYYDGARVFSPADLGIANEPEYPRGYISQLAHPFRKV